jgi:hypothetical protein
LEEGEQGFDTKDVQRLIMTNYKTQSSAINAILAQVINKTMVKIYAWYTKSAAI